MDPWFSGDSARPLTTARPAIVAEEEDGEYQRTSESGDQLSNMYRGRNLELRDYAQYTGNYRFTVGDQGEEEDAWQSVQLGGQARQAQQNHQQFNHEESLDNGGSSIMGLADAEGNGFDYASFREDSSSHYARSIAEHGSLDGQDTHATSTSWYNGEQTEVNQGDEAAAETEVLVPGEGAKGQQQEVGVPTELSTSWSKGVPVLTEAPYQRNEVVAAPMVRTGTKARETLRGMNAAEESMERALQLNIDKRFSSVTSMGGAMDSLDRICTIEELWECASVRRLSSRSKERKERKKTKTDRLWHLALAL